MIRFFLDDEEICLRNTPADLTVLEWLRTHRARTGTKEGCGSGDCGACTVVVVSLDKQRDLRFESINACIAFVGSLNGKQLLTVESLASGAELHAAQQAMLQEHGSQCGFCTPGFVMSLFALCESGDAPDVHLSPLESFAEAETQDTYTLSGPVGWLQGLDCEEPLKLSHQIDRALGGNLCRCTGYRPIKRAAAMALARKQDWLSDDTKSWLVSRLSELQPSGQLVEGYWQPSTLVELAHIYLENPDANLLAGGTDLALEVTQRLRDLPFIIDVMRVPELQVFEADVDSVLIGSAVSLTRLLEFFSDALPPVAALLLRYGSDPVRNAGTLGGNLGSASPIGDFPPVLLALGAELVLQRGSEVREVSIDDFFVDYRRTVMTTGEFIRTVRIQRPSRSALFDVYKVSKRKDDDISTVCLSMYIETDESGCVSRARLAFGGMAAVPKRAAAAEASLLGARFDAAAVDLAVAALAEDFAPLDDARASADYRSRIAGNLLRRFYLEHAGESALTRVEGLERNFMSAHGSGEQSLESGKKP